MKYLSATLISSSLLFVIGCKTTRPLDPINENYATGADYVYQPLNPATIWFGEYTDEEIAAGLKNADFTSEAFKQAILRDLDTETTRISMSRFSGKGSIQAPVAGATAKGETYILTVDYIKYFATNFPVDVTYTDAIGNMNQYEGRVPVYSGVGVRIRATFQSLTSDLNISGLPGLAIAADAGNISGNLTVQSMGISGKDISLLMPFLSDISIASIQQAVQTAASIKAKMYDVGTTVYPKIIGFESPSSDPQMVKAIAKYLYELDVYATPTVSANPQDPNDDAYIWVNWFHNMTDWQ